MSFAASSSQAKFAKAENDKEKEVTPTKILTIAIRKRQSVSVSGRFARQEASAAPQEQEVQEGWGSSYASPSYSQHGLEQLGIRDQDQVLQVTPQNSCSFSDTNPNGPFEQAMSGLSAATGFDENYDPFQGYSGFWSPSPTSSRDSSLSESCSSSASWENSLSAFSYETDFSALQPQVVEHDGYSPPSSDLTPLKPMKRRWDCGPEGMDMKRTRVEPVQDCYQRTGSRYWTATVRDTISPHHSYGSNVTVAGTRRSQIVVVKIANFC
ncbi:unnamed protein product [Bursaphelenchus xylophilus]|uniref:(pine wood nematode) hypothetical protein n=1 Tax=Bursaphelenchus xylophilus TaxID=6326 RepID=A0A7I8XM17_BURXY|nr:unnamed protein product [Bursaphelenchus xylophilus]CAG9121658.1 unnamed protein product [Bursaphelenchus xylophilus]